MYLPHARHCDGYNGDAKLLGCVSCPQEAYSLECDFKST